MGGGDSDDLEKIGHKLKAVFGNVEKLLFLGDLTHGVLL